MNWKTKLTEQPPLATVHVGERVFVTVATSFGTITTVNRIRISPHDGSVLYVMANGQWLTANEFKKAQP